MVEMSSISGMHTLVETQLTRNPVDIISVILDSNDSAEAINDSLDCQVL